MALSICEHCSHANCSICKPDNPLEPMGACKLNEWVPGAEGQGGGDPPAAAPGQRAIKGNVALLAVVSPVSVVKGGTALIVGRSISIDWLSTLFPLVTFLAKYRHFHK